MPPPKKANKSTGGKVPRTTLPPVHRTAQGQVGKDSEQVMRGLPGLDSDHTIMPDENAAEEQN
ncbi:hypothetical protein FS749_000829 [Ceratobasidium sp. UAMH 11750]|nr:hypothetical protein FS749_000829 [Ceratobasidium sp. UAMH 11750]